MFRVFGPGLIAFLVFAVWVYCILDVIATDETFIRNLPKFPWLIVILLFGPLGCIAWLALGRPQYAGWRPGGETAPPPQYRRPPSTPVRGPEDAPGFGSFSDEDRRLRDLEREERLRQWEEEKRRRGQDDADEPGGDDDAGSSNGSPSS